MPSSTGAQKNYRASNNFIPVQSIFKNSWKYYFQDSFHIIKQVVRHRKEVAAFTASSPWVINTILDHVAFGNTLEIGAGPGTITIPLVQHLAAQAPVYPTQKIRIDAVEYTTPLHQKLATRSAKLSLPSTITYTHSCADFTSWTPPHTHNSRAIYDTIISTIPFTQLPSDMTQTMLNNITHYLKPYGTFIYVALLGARALSQGAILLKKLGATSARPTKDFSVFDCWIEENFTQRSLIVYRNITPMRVYVATKNSEVDENK